MRKVSEFGRTTLAWLLLYLLVSVCALGANPFRGETVGPFDLLVSYQGWNPDAKDVSIRDPQKGDVLDYFLPTWIDARARLRDGDLPLWNALRAGGAPELVDPTNAILTPGFALFALAPSPASGYYLAALSTLMLAGVGMHLLVRRYYGDGVASLCGISFMMCGFVSAFLYMPHAQTAIWIPWLLLSIDRFFDRRRLAGMVPIAAATALCFLGGFPFVVALAIGAALVFIAAKWLESGDRADALRPAGGALAGVVLGLGVVALPLLTLADTLAGTNLGFRGAGSELSWKTDLPLLFRPWANTTGVSTTLYAGAVVMAAALLGMSSLILVRRRLESHALVHSGVVYVVVGAVLTFGILPVEVGQHLPVLANNPWVRCLLLMGVGFILVAAHGLRQFLRLFKARWVRAGLLAFLCVVQAADLGQQFRRFNGPVPSDLFYPVSPPLAELRKRLRPFQYVAQDSPSFVASGTLGAVGLPEWYAHSLRSTQLLTLLDAMAMEPFQSLTSTSIRLHQYHWRNPLLDAVGLCYGVSARATDGWGAVIETDGVRAAPIELSGKETLLQPFEIESAVAAVAFDVRFATNGESGLDGRVVMDVRSMDAGETLDTIAVDAAKIADNAPVGFFPAKPLLLVPGDYAFALRYEPGPRAKHLLAWSFQDADGSFRSGHRQIAGSLDFSIYKDIDDGLVRMAKGEHVSVFRNPDCADGPYFSRSVALSRADVGRADVRLVAYQPDAFSIRSTASEAGFVIVPMQYREGWVATVNGQAVTIERALGLLPAIAVPKGSALVVMRYRPPSFWLGFALSLLSLAILAASLTVRRRAAPDQTD